MKLLSRLTSRLVLSLALALVAVVVLLVVVSIQYQQDRLTEQVKNELAFITQNYGHGVDAALLARFEAIDDVLEALNEQDNLNSDELPSLSGVRRLFSSIWVIDTQGIVKGVWNGNGDLEVGEDLSESPLFQNLNLQQGVVSTSEPYRYSSLVGDDAAQQESRDAIIHMSAPIIQNDEWVGLLVANLSIANDPIFQQIREMTLSESGFIALSSKDGVVITHPGLPPLAYVEETQLQLMNNALERSDFYISLEQFSGVNWLQSFYRIETTGWLLGAAIPLDEALSSVYDLREVQIFTGVISSLMILLLISLIVRTQLKPLKKLRVDVNKVRHNSGYRLQKTGTYELDELVKAFNLLIDENESQRRETFQRQAYLNMVLSTSSAGHFMANSVGEIEYVNETLSAITGYSPEEIKEGALTAYAQLPAEGQSTQESWKNALNEQREFELEFKFTKADGQEIWLLLESKPVFDHGVCLGHVGTVSDVTEQNTEIHSLRSKVHLDELTNILNRRGIEEVMQSAWNESRLFNKTYTLMALDLDNFKAVNDEHGHEAGDYVLEKVAAVLSAAVRDSDWVGRLGGDEFVIVLPGCPAERAEAIAKTILQQIPEISAKKNYPSVTVSIGITEVDADDKSEVDVLRRADKAAYQAKHAGRNQSFRA